MKGSIFNNWNIMRVFRLIIGLLILVQAIVAKDMMLVIAGIIFTSMPIFNVGCCAAGSCYTAVKKNAENPKEVSYEEVV